VLFLAVTAGAGFATLIRMRAAMGFVALAVMIVGGRDVRAMRPGRFRSLSAPALIPVTRYGLDLQSGLRPTTCRLE